MTMAFSGDMPKFPAVLAAANSVGLGSRDTCGVKTSSRTNAGRVGCGILSGVVTLEDATTRVVFFPAALSLGESSAAMAKGGNGAWALLAKYSCSGDVFGNIRTQRNLKRKVSTGMMDSGASLGGRGEKRGGEREDKGERRGRTEMGERTRKRANIKRISGKRQTARREGGVRERETCWTERRVRQKDDATSGQNLQAAASYAAGLLQPQSNLAENGKNTKYTNWRSWCGAGRGS